MKKRLLFVLILIFALLFISCGDKSSGGDKGGGQSTDSNTTNANAGETQTQETAESYVFPDLNCNGETFTFLNVTTTWDFYTTIVPEAQTGEILDDSIYKRNLAVQEKFNVKLKETGVLIDDIEAQIKKTVTSGSSEFDAAYTPIFDKSYVGNMASQNIFYNLKDIPDLQLDMPWWNQKINKECEIGPDSKLYFTWCDINVMNLQAPWCVYINEDMMKNLGLDLPYNLVRDGKWTFDKFEEYAKAGAQLNSETAFPTTLAKWSPNSTAVYGYVSYEGGTRALLIGSGERFISRDGSGMPSLAIDNQRFYDICDKIAEITTPPGVYQNANDYTSGFHYEYLFRDAKALMAVAEIKAADTFRNMDSTFGIVPIPKYDETQSTYYSSVANPMPVLIVPSTVQDVQRTGIILDAMAYLSTKDVTPVFFDITMSQKRLRDEESIEMLQIVKDSVIFDVGLAYGWTAAIYNTITDSLDKGKNIAVTTIEKNRDKIAVEIQKTMDLME